MRRSDEEFKAELMLRVKDYRGKQLRRRKAWSAAATASAGVLIVALLAGPGTRPESGRADNLVTADKIVQEAVTSTKTPTDYFYSAEENEDVCEKETLADQEICLESVQIISVDVETDRKEYVCKDSEEISSVMDFLTELSRLGPEQSDIAAEFWESESAPLVGEVTEENTASEYVPQESEIQDVATVCRLTVYYADGSLHDYVLQPGEMTRSVTGESQTEMWLSAEQWKQLQELLETITAE